MICIKSIDWTTVLCSGGIIGLLELILHIVEYISSRPKIICKLDDVFDSYWVHGKDLKLKNKNKYIAKVVKSHDVVILTLKVINKKNVPITIEDFYYHDGSYEYPIYMQINFEDPLFETPFIDDETHENVDIPLITLKNNLKLPYKLDGYGAIRVRLFFIVDSMNIPDNIDISKEKGRRFCITLKTPFKDFNYNFSIYSAKYVAANKDVGFIEAAVIKKSLSKK